MGEKRVSRHQTLTPPALTRAEKTQAFLCQFYGSRKKGGGEKGGFVRLEAAGEWKGRKRSKVVGGASVDHGGLLQPQGAMRGRTRKELTGGARGSRGGNDGSSGRCVQESGRKSDDENSGGGGMRGASF